MYHGKHVLIIVENLPVPFDTRVWQEANTLKECGADVTIICPAMKGYAKGYEKLNGIDIYRHPLPVEGKRTTGFLLEYSCALYWQFVYAFRIFVRKRFHVIHGCNPPDLVFLIASLFKPLGVKFIFDHHDISPELYMAKFGKRGMTFHLIRLLERLSFQMADYSIATNDSYREIAIRRGRMRPHRVHVVRSGPNLHRLKLQPPNEFYKKGRKYLVGYVGVIGKQEGLHLLLQAVEYIVRTRTDIHFSIVGGGTELDVIEAMCKDKGLAEYVDFYGCLPDEKMVEVLSSADICVNPDEPNRLNQLSTMNKIMEYMALKKPIVQFDVKEGRVSAKESSLYARCYDCIDFAKKIMWLLDHEEQRRTMGDYGYRRIVDRLSWEHEKHNLVHLYTTVFNDKRMHLDENVEK